ncbi:MAG: T9SS type A sorting domain-containing protein [Chlorobi bacterium]|nr:T9SS type A sorting domain-containing protein [Chlorobiota bacterium]
MKYKKLKLSAVLLLSIGLIGVQAQEAIPAAGGNISGPGGSASYSVGQVVYTTNTGTNSYSVAEGVQQPYEISVVSGIEQAKGINLECTAYPNPTSDFITLKVDDFNNKNLFYQLFDIDGKIIKTEKIIVAKTEINTEVLIQGSYFLRIIDNQKEIKTFKIIKQ